MLGPRFRSVVASDDLGSSYNRLLAPLGLQSRFWDKLLEN